jgi:hypothetical protein
MATAHQQTLGPWVLHEKLGEGGNATVWRTCWRTAGRRNPQSKP